MKKDDSISRRGFLRKSAVGAGSFGAGISQSPGLFSYDNNSKHFGEKISPREVCVLSVTKDRIENNDNIVGQMVERLEIMSSYKPDIICLPEVFATSVEKAETVAGPIINE